MDTAAGTGTGGGASWAQAQEVTPANPSQNADFGFRLGISADGATLLASADEQANIGAAYVFGQPPTISSVSPAGGLANGGVSVTITGTGFRAGATVSFGGVAAANVSVVNATTITATAPQHAAGPVDVV